MKDKRMHAKNVAAAGISNTLLLPLVTAITGGKSTTVKIAAEMGFVIMEITRVDAKSASRRGMSYVLLLQG